MSFSQNNWELNQMILIKVKSAVAVSLAPSVVVSLASRNLLKGYFCFQADMVVDQAVYVYLTK